MLISLRHWPDSHQTLSLSWGLGMRLGLPWNQKQNLQDFLNLGEGLHVHNTHTCTHVHVLGTRSIAYISTCCKYVNAELLVPFSLLDYENVGRAWNIHNLACVTSRLKRWCIEICHCTCKHAAVMVFTFSGNADSRVYSNSSYPWALLFLLLLLLLHLLSF